MPHFNERNRDQGFRRVPDEREDRFNDRLERERFSRDRYENGFREERSGSTNRDDEEWRRRFEEQRRWQTNHRDDFERGFDDRHRVGQDRHPLRDDDYHADFRGDFDETRRFNPDYGSELRGEFHDRYRERGEPRGVVYRRFARPEMIDDDPDYDRRNFESHEWGRTEEDLKRQLRDDRERWLDEMEWRRRRRMR